MTIEDFDIVNPFPLINKNGIKLNKETNEWFREKIFQIIKGCLIENKKNYPHLTHIINGDFYASFTTKKDLYIKWSSYQDRITIWISDYEEDHEIKELDFYLRIKQNSKFRSVINSQKFGI